MLAIPKYYELAHTDRDISVTLDDADILHLADTYWNSIYPFIDYSTGGCVNAMIASQMPARSACLFLQEFLPSEILRAVDSKQCAQSCGREAIGNQIPWALI
jgi:hypothetical protein